MATLLGDATLTTSSSIAALDPIVATSDRNKTQTTVFRKPVSMDRITGGGSSAIIYTGTFAGISTIGAADLKKFADPGYVDDYTEDPEPLTVNTAGVPFNPDNNDIPLQTPRFFFDFAEIRELTTTTVDEVTFKITVTPTKLFNTGTPFAEVSTGNMRVFKTNFQNFDSINDVEHFGAPQTVTVGQQSTHTFTCNSATLTDGTRYLSHSGTFLPIAVEIQVDKLGQFTIDSIECQIKYTGKTLLKGDYIKNDTLTYTQTAGDSSTIKPGEKQGRMRALDASATDEISFNWNAGRFTVPDDLIVDGMQVSEYIQMTRGQGASATSFPYASSLFTALETGSGMSMDNVKIENGQYTMTQDGSDKGNVFPNTTRDWQVDDGDFSAYFGGAGNRSVRNEIARPNVLTDQTISNIDRTDLSTAISLKVPFSSADGTALSSGNDQFNMGNEWEHYKGTGNSPTGNSAWEDLHSQDLGNFVDDRAPYRATVLPAATQAYLRFLFAPTTKGQSSITGTFTKTFGTLGIKHGLAASDIDTQASSFTQVGQGGFLLEGSATISSAMTFGINAGFQLSVIESESTTATMTFDDDGLRLAIRAQATPSSAFALTEDVDLFVGGEAPMISAFTETLTQSEIGIILTIDTVLELPALASSMTVVAAGQSLPGPDLARTFVLETADTRTLQVIAQTRTNTVNTQTRTTVVDAQTRIATVDSQNRETTLTRWDQSPTWRGYKTWSKVVRPRVLKITGYDG